MQKQSLTSLSFLQDKKAFLKATPHKPEAGLISRSVWASLFVIALVSLYALFLASPAWALIYAASALWSTLNVYLWHKLLLAFLINRRKYSAMYLAAIKLPILYIAGFLLLKFFRFSLVPFLAGFNTIFVILALKILGREYVTALAKSANALRHKQG
jgi:hypothetical protein